MDPETRKCLLEFCRIMEEAFLANAVKINGVEQVLRKLVLRLAETFLGTRDMQDFLPLLDEITIYLDYGMQEEQLAWQMLRRMEVFIGEQNGIELAVPIIRQTREAHEQAQNILQKIARRRQYSLAESLSAALHPFTGELL